MESEPRAQDVGRSELVRGEFRAMIPPGAEHGRVTIKLTLAIGNAVEAGGLGTVYAVETGFLLARNPDTVRAPDIAFVRAARPPAPSRGYYVGASDLAVEVLSPDDRPGYVAEKVAEWLEAGAQVVWVVDPHARTVAVHEPGLDPRVVDERGLKYKEKGKLELARKKFAECVRRCKGTSYAELAQHGLLRRLSAVRSLPRGFNATTLRAVRATLLVLGLCCAAGAGPDGAVHGQKVARIIAAIEAREKATGSFCAEYYETSTGTGNRRMGPRFLAWSPDRSLYRGPKLGNAVPVLGWFTKDRVERDSLYFRDRTQSFWLHRETEPIQLLWSGTQGRSDGPDSRSETGLFWLGRPLSAFLGTRAVTIVGIEAVDGDPCVKLLVHDKRDGHPPWPLSLWLSKACGYFPRRLVAYHIVGQDTVRSYGTALRIGDWFCYATEEYRWEDLRRKGQVWYPMRIRIEPIGFEPGLERLIEVVEGSARFGHEVTDQDFELPGLYFLKDDITGDYVAVTPLGRITLEATLASAAAALLLLLFRLRRRRRHAT